MRSIASNSTAVATANASAHIIASPLALVPGTRLGPYDITAPIGEGGMGAVYRATDTSLGRQVAIKVLPDAFAQDAERLARFEREAKTLAALNHPNIAAIYGFERSSDTPALVMELVDGDDLSQRLARGPIPLADALPIAGQIADALAAAGAAPSPVIGWRAAAAQDHGRYHIHAGCSSRIDSDSDDLRQPR